MIVTLAKDVRFEETLGNYVFELIVPHGESLFSKELMLLEQAENMGENMKISSIPLKLPAKTIVKGLDL